MSKVKSQKLISLLLLASFATSAFALPIRGVLAAEPKAEEVISVAPVFAGGLSALFSIGGASCAAGGILGGLKSIGSAISGLGSLAADGLGKLFGGGGGNLPGAFQDVAGPGTSPLDVLDAEFGSQLNTLEIGEPGFIGPTAGDTIIEDAFPTEFGDIGDMTGGIDAGLLGSAAGIAGKLLGGLLGGGGGSKVPVIDEITNKNTQVTANATTKTAAHTGQLVQKECTLDPIVKALTAIVLRALTASIVGWIQGGSSGFVSDFETELRQQLNARAGEFLNQLAGVNLCGNIGAFLNISLRFPTGLRQRLECTVTDIIKNVQGFYRNFGNGGWPAFIRISLEPQNNPYGAYLIALDAKIAAEGAREGAFSANVQAGAGFIGFRVKKKVNCIPNPERAETEVTGEICQTVDDIRTPGGLVADLLNASFKSDIDWLVIADEVDESIYAIINALISKLLTSSFGEEGRGIFESELSGDSRVDRGDFADSGLDAQFAREIMRADAAIVALDSRELKALQDVFAKGVTLRALEITLASLQSQLSTATDPDIIASLQSQIAATQKSIDDTKRQMRDAQNLFELAGSTKRNVVLVKSELLMLRATLLNTDNLADVQQLAEQRITLTNLLDAFLETASIGVGDLRPNSDLQINTLQHIQEAQNIAQRAINKINDTIKGLIDSGRPGFASNQAALISNRIEINSSLNNLLAVRAALMTSLPPEEGLIKAIEALAQINVVTRRSLNGSATVNDALRAFVEAGSGPPPPPGLSADLLPNISSGAAPLNITFTGLRIGGDNLQTTWYTFWWNCNNANTSYSGTRAACGDPGNSAFGREISSASGVSSITVSHAYTAAGNYHPKLLVSQGGPTSPGAIDLAEVNVP